MSRPRNRFPLRRGGESGRTSSNSGPGAAPHPRVQITKGEPPILVCGGQGPLPNEVPLIGSEDLSPRHRHTEGIKNNALNLDSYRDHMLNLADRAWFQVHIGARTAVELNRPGARREIIEFHSSVCIQGERKLPFPFVISHDVAENTCGRRSVSSESRVDSQPGSVGRSYR